jgi:hypothetical protein
MLRSGESKFKAKPWQTVLETPSPKWTGGVSQVIEDRLCNSKALSSNSSFTKKQINEQNPHTSQAKG